MGRKDNRKSSDERGYDSAWRKVRAIKVKKSPVCERCLKRGVYVPIEVKRGGHYGVVHHIKSVEEYPELRLKLSNLESLCFECHEAEHGRLMITGCDLDGMPLNPEHRWNKEIQDERKKTEI